MRYLIILIAGDNDFVPAAKLARISGIDLAAILKDILKQEPDIKPPW